MKLSQILPSNACEPDVEFTSVTEDSRRVKPGALFVAVAGEHADGHAYIADAVAQGAVAVLGSRPETAPLPHAVPYCRVDNPRRLLGLAAHGLAGDPSRAMTVVGITGTNGKSSTVTLTQQILLKAGHPTAAFGTLGYEIAGRTIPAKHTTPFAEELADIFKQAHDAAQSHVVMEASSHALDQDRVAGIDFDVAAFTNLTQDHFDYHKDLATYRAAKLKLFTSLSGPNRFTVVNREDPNADAFIDASTVTCYTYGSGGDCHAEELATGMRQTTFRVVTPWGEKKIELALLGRHNVLNALCATAICGGLGLSLDAIAEGIASVSAVPGRFEHVDAGQDFQVIVDYAHTDDGLRNVLRAAREICTNRIILVFGCGGDRDKAKRPKMAAAAAEGADFAFITSDNPRTEDPTRILLDIESGIQFAGSKKNDDYLVIADRAEAIRQAIALARPGDLVLIAGKGHEDYQIIGTERIHFDDREVARNLLEEM